MKTPKRDMCLKVFFTSIFALRQSIALHNDCAEYFEGFSLPSAYNPNVPPANKSFAIDNYMFVKEVTKVNSTKPCLSLSIQYDNIGNQIKVTRKLCIVSSFILF